MVTTIYENAASTPWLPATPLREPAATEPRRTHPADGAPGGAGQSPAGRLAPGRAPGRVRCPPHRRLLRGAPGTH